LFDSEANFKIVSSNCCWSLAVGVFCCGTLLEGKGDACSFDWISFRLAVSAEAAAYQCRRRMEAV
jgi:hypothetical protein